MNTKAKITTKTKSYLNEYGLRHSFVNFVALVFMHTFIYLFGISTSPVQAQESLNILALGDSLTAGYGLPQPDAFPVQLQAALKIAGKNVTVINGGVSGDTSTGGRARLDWLVSADIDGVILELGANDGLRGLDPKLTQENLDWILSQLHHKSIPVLLTGMQAPPNLGPEYEQEFNGMFPTLAAKHGVLLYPFFLDGVAADPQLNQADGIHPNAQGVAIIVKRMLPSVMTLIAQATQP